MNLYKELKRRENANAPIKVGVIGAGKFSSMFLSQAVRTPGIQLVGIAEIDPQKAKESCVRVGWPEETLANAKNANEINDIASSGKVAITEDSMELINSEAEVILEITGNPEVGTKHALAAIKNKKHIVMVNVETDCLVGPRLNELAEEAGVCYSMAYGDQPALIMEQIDWARTVGFDVICAGKGTRFQPEFHYSNPETVWGYYGFTEETVATGNYNAQMFNSFLDGTKSAIEMCAVSNAAALMPARDGLKFPPVSRNNLQEVLIPKTDGGILPHVGTVECVASEDRFQVSVNDNLRWGVYVTLGAPSEYVERCFFEYGVSTNKSGKYAAIYRPYHFIGLELGLSVASIAIRNESTGCSKWLMGDVATTAKKDLKPGDILDGEGGYTAFGKLVQATDSLHNEILPLGLAHGAKVKRPISKDQTISYNDVEINESLVSYQLRREMETMAKQGKYKLSR